MIKQRHVAALLTEYFGTVTLVLVVLSVSQYRFPLFTALAAGVTAAVFVSAFAKVSGGHLNPAVSLGMFVTRQVTALRAVAYVAAQLLAGYSALQLYQYLTGRDLTNSTSTSIDWKVALAEFIGAFVFGLAISAVVAQKMEGYQAAYTVGAGLFLGLTVAGLASNAIINPAVALGVRAFEPVSYVTAPILGMIVSMVLGVYYMFPGMRLRGSATMPISVPKAPALTVPDVPKPPVAKKATTKPATKKASVKKPATKKAPAKKTK